MDELKSIMQKFAGSGYDVIAVPARKWLDGNEAREDLISAVRQADKECGSCGCELDPLYKRALELLGDSEEICSILKTVKNCQIDL